MENVLANYIDPNSENHFLKRSMCAVETDVCTFLRDSSKSF